MIRISFRKDARQVGAIHAYLERRASGVRRATPSDTWPRDAMPVEVFAWYAFDVSISMSTERGELLEVDETGSPCEAPQALADAMAGLRHAVASIENEGDTAGWVVWNDNEPALFRNLDGHRVLVEVESNGRSAIVDLAELKGEALRVSREAADWMEESLPDTLKDDVTLRYLARLRAPLQSLRSEDLGRSKE